MRFRVPRFAAALISAGALALLAAPQAHAQASGPRTLTVSGEGEAKGAPNQAQLSAGVVSTAKTAAAALAANTRAMNAVFATLKKAGVADKDMQTSDFSVQPQYSTVNTIASSSGQQRITGYQVSNTVSVTVENLATLGLTLDALVSSGANSIGEISFGFRNPQPLLAQARAAAVADAITRAQTYAKAAGVALGPITAIGESGYDQPRPMMAMGMLKANPVPVATGEQSVTAGVSITWALR